MKIATWNVNSISVRLEHLSVWIRSQQPDILLLQELKCVEEKFPSEPLEDLGYNIAIYGQKTYNGVAILSKYPIEDVVKGLSPHDPQARYIEAFTGGVRVASVYAPNGEEVGSEKFAYKLDFYETLFHHLQKLLELEEKSVIGGDYNIAPYDVDVSPLFKIKGERILCSSQERAALFKLYNLGFVDAIRSCHPSSTQSGKDLYSWWDYRGGSWEQNKGMRIDHLLLSPQAADHLKNAHIDIKPRTWKRPGDHVPVMCELYF